MTRQITTIERSFDELHSSYMSTTSSLSWIEKDTFDRNTDGKQSNIISKL
jgi:hypothetical protein